MNARRCAVTLALALVVATAAQNAAAQPAQQDAQQPSGQAPQPGDNQGPQVMQRAEPSAQAPADPLEMSDEVKARIGTDSDLRPASPEGKLETSYFPYYEEKKGDYRFRFLPPLLLEHTRGLPDPAHQLSYGIPQHEDREGLYGMFFYQRRSLKLDADVLFPFAWRVRDRENHVLVLGPAAHREAPGEHDNWLAPLFFEGERKDGGYFHSPALLTTTHWGSEGAFTIVGPYFRDRTKSDVDWGVVPFFFHGDTGETDGTKKTYTLVPPALYYHRWNELEDSQMTVVGPFISKSDPKRGVFDVAPFLFHIWGKPETGGIREHHTTLFPLFHYGESDDASLFVVPGYLRRKTRTVDTMLTPLYSHATTRNGSTSFDALGPILPIWYDYRDRDVGMHAWAVAPFYYQADGPKGHDFLTPLVGKFETRGVSKSWWVFPSMVFSTGVHGWETDLHPLLYLGRSDKSSHTVFAPVFWDFATPRGRTTIGFPLYWRFADTGDESVVQVAANTLYIQKRAVGGLDWQFHVLPLFSYGETPNGHWWNVLFGLAGYDREGSYARIKALWIPIQVAGPDAKQMASSRP